MHWLLVMVSLRGCRHLYVPDLGLLVPVLVVLLRHFDVSWPGLDVMWALDVARLLNEARSCSINCWLMEILWLRSVHWLAIVCLVWCNILVWHVDVAVLRCGLVG